jgi:hypothetical protein
LLKIGRQLIVSLTQEFIKKIVLRVYGGTTPARGIGESSNISSRLYNHEQTFGEDACFAYAERSDLDASHKRREIETDLIGAYYLDVGEAPLAQFGHTENIPV